MGIFVKKLTIDPDTFTGDKTTANIAFVGFVDTAADNPVTVTIAIPADEDGTPVSFINDSGQKVRSITYTAADFKTNDPAAQEKRPLTVSVGTPAGDNKIPCRIEITAVTKAGDSDSTLSKLFFKK
jgi:hypothetical protein